MVVGFAWAFVIVCGWPGLLVVVEVTCGQHGGMVQLWWLSWWLWDEDRRCVTICSICEFGSTFVAYVDLDQHLYVCACNHAHTEICSVHYMYSFVVYIIQFCRVLPGKVQ